MQNFPSFSAARILTLVVCCALLAAPGASRAASPDTAPPAKAPADKALSGDVIVMGPMTIDKVKKEIHIAVRTAIDQGVLEYLLVEDKGKAYESAFKADGAMASELNFALLLLGCEPLDFAAFQDLAKKEEGGRILQAEHAKSLVAIDLLRKGQKAGLSSVMQDREGEKAPLLWVCTGSYFAKDGRFAGDISRSHIALWPDPSAVINLFSSRGNPYRGELGFQMNADNKDLKKDVEYTLVIAPLQR